MEKLDDRFGLVPAHSRFLSDRSGTMELADMHRLRDELRLFHRKFPQSLLSVLVTELEPGTSVSEYAFWIANRARFTSMDKKRGENFNLLLLIDLTNGAAALTSGYGLEPYVPEETLAAALDEFLKAYRASGLAAAISACVESLVRQLRERAKQARHPKQKAGRGHETW